MKYAQTYIQQQHLVHAPEQAFDQTVAKVFWEERSKVQVFGVQCDSESPGQLDPRDFQLHGQLSPDRLVSFYQAKAAEGPILCLECPVGLSPSDLVAVDRY
jgi:hypothetical protein